MSKNKCNQFRITLVKIEGKTKKKWHNIFFLMSRESIWFTCPQKKNTSITHIFYPMFGQKRIGLKTFFLLIERRFGTAIF